MLLLSDLLTTRGAQMTDEEEKKRGLLSYPFTKPGSSYIEHNIGKAVFHVNSRYTNLSPVSAHRSMGKKKSVTVI